MWQAKQRPGAFGLQGLLDGNNVVHCYIIMQGAEQDFPSSVAARVSGVPLATVTALAASGVLVPSVSAPQGRGTSRRYSLADLVALRLVAHGRLMGLSAAALQPLLESIQRLPLGRPSEELPTLALSETGAIGQLGAPSSPKVIDLGGALRVVVELETLLKETVARELEVTMLLRGRGRPRKEPALRPSADAAASKPKLDAQRDPEE